MSRPEHVELVERSYKGFPPLERNRRMVEARSRPVPHLECSRYPRRQHRVIGIAREAIGPERHDLVGVDDGQDLVDARDCFFGGNVIECPVRIAEEVLLGYTEALERGLQLVTTNVGEGFRIHRLAEVKAGLPTCHVDAYDSISAANGVGPESSRDESFVVRVCPDPQDRRHRITSGEVPSSPRAGETFAGDPGRGS